VVKRSARETEWELAWKDYERQREAWGRQAEDLYMTAQEEWGKARGSVNEGYNQWRRKFVREYQEKTEEWERNHAKFAGSKQRWIEDQYVYAASVGSAGALEQAGGNVEAAIRELLGELEVERMGREEIEAGPYITTLLAGTNLAALLSRAGSLGERGGFGVGLARRGARRTTGAASLAAAAAAIEEAGQNMRKAAAKRAAGQVERLIEEAKKSYREKLKAENEGMWDWETRLARNSGRAVGNDISRDAVVGATILGARRERQTIRRYRDFEAAEAALSVDLSREGLEGLDADVIMALIARAERDLKAWGDRIFGEIDEETKSAKQVTIARSLKEANTVSGIAAAREAYEASAEKARLDKLTERGYDKLSESERSEYNELARNTVKAREGELGAHIGYAPEFKNNPDLDAGAGANLLSAGGGEIGKILLDFQWNNLLNSGGYAELAKPMYDQKMWEGEALGIEAPTLRTVVSMAMDIVGRVAPGGALLAYVDDLLFAGLDVAGGYKDLGEAALSLAKTAAMAGVKAGTGALFSGVGVAEEQALAVVKGGGFFETGGINHWIESSFSGWDQVGMSALSAGAQTALTTTSGLAVNSFEIKDGRLSFNGESFAASMGAMDTWASVASAAAGSLAGGALGQANLKDGNGITLNGHTFDTKSIQKFNSLMGSLAGTGVSYAMTGEATLNILNLRDFTGNNGHNLGLLELRLGGDKGFSAGLGSGGADLSYGAVTAAMAGARDSGKIIGAKLGALGGNIEDISTLNAINMMGWTGDGLNQKIAKVIWDDRLKVRYGDLGGDYGEYRIGGGTVTISETLLGGGKEGGAKLAAVMAHEGTHVAGYRIEGLAHIQGNGTYNAINALFGLRGDSVFSDSMISAIMDPESWKENTGDIDYWKVIVKADGSYKMENDRSDNITVYSESDLTNPLAFFAYTGGSRTGFIAETLGISKEQVNTAMGLWSGWTYTRENGWINNDIGRTAADGTIVDGVVRFGDELSKWISFPLDTAQRAYVENILGPSYNNQAVKYEDIRISYANVSADVLRGLTTNPGIASALSSMSPNDITSLINNTVADERILSLPGGRIYFPVKDYNVNNLNATLATLTHEVFHQFQYMNMGVVAGFMTFVGEQSLYTQNGVNVYHYQTYNNVGGQNAFITQLADIKYREGEAQFIEDFALRYNLGSNNNLLHTVDFNNMSTGAFARALRNSGLDSAAIRDAEKWR
jgi:hypothetical protein